MTSSAAILVGIAALISACTTDPNARGGRCGDARDGLFEALQSLESRHEACTVDDDCVLHQEMYSCGDLDPPVNVTFNLNCLASVSRAELPAYLDELDELAREWCPKLVGCHGLSGDCPTVTARCISGRCESEPDYR